MPEADVRCVLIVNGLPASGKSTLGRWLADRLSWPFISRDTLKEPVFDALGIRDRETNRALGRGIHEGMWAMVGEFPDQVSVVVESWFGASSLPLVRAGLERARCAHVAEVWCEAPVELLVERYLARVAVRHPAHPGAEFEPELRRLASEAAPLGVGPTLRVATDRVVDREAVLAWVTDVLSPLDEVRAR